MSAPRKSSVRVTIMGEEYAIRSDAPPEHTRRVAEYVDRAIRHVQSNGSLIETHKAAILAALQITDELFREREASDVLAEDVRTLTAEVRRWLPPAKRGEGAGAG
ncbi:MAG TPA: cell division protein ZapA [Gemmatimonadaceae bacterium]